MMTMLRIPSSARQGRVRGGRYTCSPGAGPRSPRDAPSAPEPANRHPLPETGMICSAQALAQRSFALRDIHASPGVAGRTPVPVAPRDAASRAGFGQFATNRQIARSRRVPRRDRPAIGLPRQAREAALEVSMAASAPRRVASAPVRCACRRLVPAARPIARTGRSRARPACAADLGSIASSTARVGQSTVPPTHLPGGGAEAITGAGWCRSAAHRLLLRRQPPAYLAAGVRSARFQGAAASRPRR